MAFPSRLCFAALVGVAAVSVACAPRDRSSPGKIEVPAQPNASAPSGGGPSPPPSGSVAVLGRPPPRIVRLSHSEAECGLDEAGAPWRWGTGELEPLEPSLRGLSEIACGGRHFCVAAGDGIASCWGNNECGDLGDGTAAPFRDEPVKVVGLPPVAEIGNTHCRTCARTTTGDVYCWGDTAWGKAGDGTLKDDSMEATRSRIGSPVLRDATMLSVTLSHTCAVVKDGRVACWGAGIPSGQAKQSVAKPTFVPKVKDVVQVATAENVTCVVDRAGAVTCWGQNPNGVLGPNAEPSDYRTSPAPVAVPLAEKAIAVAVGSGGHACARLASDTLTCWGKNDRGQLGDGTNASRRTPAKVNLPGKVIDIAAGLDVTCALVDSGKVFCFGDRVKRSSGRGLEASSSPIQMRLR